MATPNYNITTVEPTDKATWLTTFNEAMNEIDTSLKNIADSIPESGKDWTNDINNIKSDISTIQSNISTINEHLSKLVNVVCVSESGEGITAQQYSNLTVVNA